MTESQSLKRMLAAACVTSVVFLAAAFVAMIVIAGGR
jgi:hypothetical protein